MHRRAFLIVVLAAFALGTFAATSPASIKWTEIKDIRYFASKEYVRVVVDLASFTNFKQGEIKDYKKIYFDLSHASARSFTKRTIDVDNSILRRIRVGQFTPDIVRVVLDLDNFEEYKIFTLTNPDRVIVDIYGARDTSAEPVQQVKPAEVDKPTEKTPEKTLFKEPETAKEPEKAKEAAKSQEKPKEPEKAKEDEKPSDKTKEADKSKDTGKPADKGKHKTKEKDGLKTDALIARKTIVIDPGHGGHDPGAISKNGLKEKDVVLDISLQLVKILRERYFFDVHMTRKTDKFITLDERTAIANGKRADMFVSVHANANNSPSVRGLETYFLNFSNSEEALRVAARENAISIKRMKEVQTELGLILASLARESKRDESLRLSHYIQKSMHSTIGKSYKGVADHGVKQALFYVLVGASMPSALVEVSYLTNPEEEKLLGTDEYREILAESIATGINKYVSTLPDAPQYAKAIVRKK
ncbi:MAG: N-acetylmuramoyl-L-alanine amidase [Nitrospirae bacterium]|nr:N-acetylmuramoyl-L-alanine amidase [Nitrospirota bacterium]